MNERLRHGDAFCGIGGFGYAAHLAGWETVWACEIEPAARAVYSTRLGHPGLRFDTDIAEAKDIPEIDILTGGWPCQDHSIAGAKRGIEGARSGLFFELARILKESWPRWFVFENVPNLLHNRGGQDFDAVATTLAELGYGFAWRVLDARYFGLAQRRKRLFLVGRRDCDPARAAEILFDPTSGGGNPLPRPQEATDIAAAVVSRAAKGGFTDPVNDNIIVDGISGALLESTSGKGRRATDQSCVLDDAATLVSNSKGGMRTTDIQTYVVSDPVTVHGGRRYTSEGNCFRTVNVVFDDPRRHNELHRGGEHIDISPTLATEPRQWLVGETPDAAGVRDLAGLPAPLDLCEIDENGPDTPRYRGLGNAVAVPVIRWIFNRINDAERRERG